MFLLTTWLWVKYQCGLMRNDAWDASLEGMNSCFLCLSEAHSLPTVWDCLLHWYENGDFGHIFQTKKIGNFTLQVCLWQQWSKNSFMKSVMCYY